MKPRLKLSIGLALISLFTVAGLFIGAQSGVLALQDATLGNTSPWPGNSQMDGESGVIHVHFLRKQGVTNGSQPNVELKAYYPKNVSGWNSLNLFFTPGNPLNDDHVCDAEATGMTPAQKNKFIGVTLKTGGGAANQITYWIPYANVCVRQDHNNQEGVNDNNIFYGNYKLPPQPNLDPDTNKYVVDVIISYSPEVPQGSNGIRFLVKGDGGAPDIGPLGSVSNNTSFSILADWSLKDQNNITPTSMVIPFGLACSQTSDIPDAKVRIYDADNGLFTHTVRFRVKNLDTGNYVTFSGKGSDNAGPGQWGGANNNDRTIYIPPNGSGNTVKTAWATMNTFQAGVHYQMEISGIDTRNTIDVGVPGDPIFGVVNCGWKMKPDSTANNAVAAPGDTVTFKHTATNVGAFDTPNNIDITAKWGTTGQITTGNVTVGGIVSSVSPDNPITDKSYSADTSDASNARTITTKIVIPANAANNTKYCQFLRVNHHSNKDNASVDSTPVCVTVQRVCAPPDPACPPPTRKVLVQAYVNSGADAETQTTASFTGGVNVSNYPDISNQATADGQYGYSEVSQPVTAVRTTAVMDRDGLGGTQSTTTYSCPAGWTPANPTSAVTCTGPVVKTYDCPLGGTLSGTACTISYSATAVYGCPGGGSLSGTTCTKTYPGKDTKAACEAAGHNWSGGTCKDTFAAQVTSYSCPSGGVASGTTCYNSYSARLVSSTTPSQPATATTKYRYYCNETNTWNPPSPGWTTTYPDTCRDHYKCPGTAAAGQGWADSASGITCNSWNCNYGSAPSDARNPMTQTNPPTCEYRCPSTGARAWFDQNIADYTGTGDRRCFVRPTFNLVCTWDTGAVTTDTVTGNGNYCINTSTTKPAGSIGTVVSATLTPSQTGGWQPSNPQPGMITSKTTGATSQAAIWGWDFRSGSSSDNVVGMPYVKVYGGDVRVGGGVGGTSQACAFNNAATIKTYSTPTTGSGTQFAAISSGFIDRFVSGQYNPLGATPDIGNAPTKLTFANNAGGSGYGGGFGSAGACYNYVEKLPDDTQTSTGATAINGHTLGVGAKEIKHVKGNAYISGNIAYNSGTRTSSAQIPLYELVVEGDIYIDSSVTQLDGIYVAIPTSSSAGGNIYTCAFVSGASATLPSTTYQSGPSNCKRQLVVNGAVAAKQIKFGRDCGSLILSQANEPTNLNDGGTNAQTCGNSNHAAEVFNFTPEVWIRSSSATGSTKYDSISSLPPIL